MEELPVTDENLLAQVRAGTEAAWQDLSRRGVECVLEKHTYRHRLQTVFEMLGRGVGRSGEAVAP